MSYRLDLVNRAELFEDYASWYNDNNANDDAHNNITFRITSLILSFEEIDKLTKESIEKFSLFESKINIDKHATEINFLSPSLYEIFINISNIFSSIRILQNSLINIINKQESKLGNKLSLPNSINPFMKKIKTFPINEDVKNLLTMYWEENGKLIKHYRDIDEHHNFLLNKVYVNNFSDKKLIILLPDNPEVKSSKEYTFKKNINALTFLISEFYKIENLFNSISRFYGYSNDEFHLTFKIHDENPNNLTIVSDPYHNYLVGLESYQTKQGIETSQHIIPSDLNKYSFLKLPKLFKNEKRFEKIYKIEEAR